MNRRAFLATTAAGAAVAAFPTVLKAQGGDTIKIGFPGPTTGPFGALAKDQQQGAIVAMEEINATGGVLGKKWWILYADYAWGKQNNAVLSEVLKRQGGVLLGSTPYPLGNPEFSAHLPKILAAKPEVLITMTPGADNIAFLKQAISFGMKKEMKIAQPLHWLPQLKEGGPDLYADIYAGISFSWQLEEAIPEAKNYVALYRKKHNEPPGDYSAYAYSAIHEVARGITLAKVVNSDAVASALIANPVYNHYKGKQWWRACDHKAFQDLWIVKGRERSKMKGEWDFVDIVQRVVASEELDRSCKEKGFV